MGEKWAGVISYLIGIALMIPAIMAIKRKYAGQPDAKIAGVPIKKLYILWYITIGILVVFAIAKFMGWE